jgi:hypothetical protein
LSETLVWLLYFIAGGLAFAAVFHLRWRIVTAMVLPTVFVTVVYYLLIELGKEENEPSWINVDLALNASFALIFAGAGAALGMYVLMKKGRPERSDEDA